ncbi:LA_3334 family protein [Leptospira wolffii]|uniref:LA_3334 family protein n=1 Tax=Leptospira wolffii TaxID=409998 RepID=UPI0002E724D5|nr:hypothetical protein [Leptospira wolffii]EPG67850.1 hypothetical protein LEP1GSC061_0977 [Leptospira wolffii serovar Khorat str. Khorat-H2]
MKKKYGIHSIFIDKSDSPNLYYAVYKVGLFFLIFIPPFFSPSYATEVLLKSGDAFLVESATEREEKVFVTWKDRKYRIPKEDIQRIDSKKTGPDTSYVYSSVKLKDGTVLKGILVERKNELLVLKTDLGFVELESSRIVSVSPETIPDLKPELPESYLEESRDSSGSWKIGLTGAANVSFGPWSESFPRLFDGGGFLEKSSIRPGEFFGFRSAYAYGKGSEGQLSIWSHDLYYGKNFSPSPSSPYILFGIGASSISWSKEDRSKSGTDPNLLLEFGWNWDRPGNSVLRIGLQSQCSFESGANLCTGGLRFSWGAYL